MKHLICGGKSLFLFGLLFLFGSCQTKSSGRHTEIIIDNTSINKLFSFDQLAESFEVVKLETTKESIINNIFSKLILSPDFIYCIEFNLDGRVTIFNRKTGKFIKQLKPLGEGPGEFNYITDVALNAKNQIEVYSNIQKKVLTYSPKGDFIKERKTYFNYEKRLIFDNCILDHFNGPNADFLGTEKDHKIILLDSVENIKAKYFPFKFNNNEVSGSSLNFFQFKNDILVSELFQPELYSLGCEKNLQLKYKITFKKNNPDSDFFEKNKTIGTRLNFSFKNDVPFFDLVFENNRYLVVRYNYIQNQSRIFIYDKQDKKTVSNANTLFLSKHSWPLTLPNYVYNEGLIFLYPAQTYKELYNMSFNNNSSGTMKKIALETNPDDNPILLILKLKN